MLLARLAPLVWPNALSQARGANGGSKNRIGDGQAQERAAGQECDTQAEQGARGDGELEAPSRDTRKAADHPGAGDEREGAVLKRPPPLALGLELPRDQVSGRLAGNGSASVFRLALVLGIDLGDFLARARRFPAAEVPLQVEIRELPRIGWRRILGWRWIRRWGAVCWRALGSSFVVHVCLPYTALQSLHRSADILGVAEAPGRSISLRSSTASQAMLWARLAPLPGTPLSACEETRCDQCIKQSQHVGTLVRAESDANLNMLC